MRPFHPVLQKYNFQLMILLILMENYEHALFAHFVKASTFIHIFSRELKKKKNPFPILTPGQLSNTTKFLRTK